MQQINALDLDVASALSLGARERQEDALAVAFSEGAEMGFAVLSDGMGGHAAGDLASRLIVSEVFAELTLRSRDPHGISEDLPMLLRHAVNVANDSLRAHVDACPSRQGMGGTVIATAVINDALYWVSVGDSTLYLYRDGTLSRLNQVHSMAAQMEALVDRGLMDKATAAAHPHRNCLTSAVMGDDLVEVDCPRLPCQLHPGDVIVVASDGLDVIDEARILDILRRTDHAQSRALAQDLMAAVGAAGNPQQDNTSLIVIRAEEPMPAPQSVQIVHRPVWARAVGWLMPSRAGS